MLRHGQVDDKKNIVFVLVLVEVLWVLALFLVERAKVVCFVVIS